MPPTGYCTLEDVRRALRKAELPGDVMQDEQIAVDAIAAETRWLEKTYLHHWYEPDGISEAEAIDIPTEPNTRDDEHDIPSSAAHVHGSDERDRARSRRHSDTLLETRSRRDRRKRSHRNPKRRIRLAFGDATTLDPPVDESVPAYTRITLERRNVQELNELYVVTADGTYEDWVDSDEYDGGVGKIHRGKDYWVRINNDGVSELYLNVHAMDDDLPSLSNAVYVDIDYGREGIPHNVRRATALRAAAELAEDAVVEIPQNATVYNVETKAEEMREKALELLDVE